MEFRKWIEQASERNRSPIVLALDVEAAPEEIASKASDILRKTASSICAVKFGFVSLLPLGLGRIRQLIELAHELELPTIMDCKLGDVGHVSEAAARRYFEAGFDAITVNPVVGWAGALQPVFELAKREQRGVLMLGLMSHPGASEFFDHLFEALLRRALHWKADGVIVGATRPDKVRRAKLVLADLVPIYSPGVIAQGGKVEEAMQAGARYLIVGRAIVAAANPAQEAKRIASLAKISKS